MKKSSTLVILILLNIVMMTGSCVPVEIIFSDEESSNQVQTGLTTELPLVFSTETLNIVITPSEKPSPSLSPTVMNTSTTTHTPTIEVNEPIIVVIRWPLYSQDIYNDFDPVFNFELLINHMFENDYAFTTLENIEKENKAVVLIFQDVYFIDESNEPTLRDVWDLLKEKNFPAVVGVAGGFLQAWSQDDTDYLKELLQSGWQLANGGYANIGYLSSEDRAKDPKDIKDFDVNNDVTKAHNINLKLLGVFPEGILLPHGLGYDNPEVYKYGEDLSYKFVVGFTECSTCGNDQIFYYPATLFENFQP